MGYKLNVKHLRMQGLLAFHGNLKKIRCVTIAHTVLEALKEHLVSAALRDDSVELRRADLPLERDELRGAFFLDLLRYLTAHFSGGRATARGVGEDMDHKEVRALCKFKRFIEILVRLTGEADDYIRRIANGGYSSAQSLHIGKRLIGVIFALHVAKCF